jgi:hypothetical protein
MSEGKSAARVLVAEETDDWLNFYVGMYVMTRVTICNDTYWIYSFADRDLMIRHHGGGIGHLQDVCSADPEQNDLDMVQEDSGTAEDDTRSRSESNVAVESDSESETDYDMDSGSERGENGSSDDDESDGYATP